MHFTWFDFSTIEGRAAAKRYKVLGPPHFIVMNTQGEIVARRPGFQTYEALKADIVQALAPP